MALTKLGLNLTNLNNLTAPTFDIKNTTQEIIDDIPNKANSVTNGSVGIIALSGLFAFLLWKLNQEQAEGGDYGYSTSRSIGISFSICSIIGIYCLNLGYFTNFYHVALFIIGTFIMLGVVWKSQT